MRLPYNWLCIGMLSVAHAPSTVATPRNHPAPVTADVNAEHVVRVLGPYCWLGIRVISIPNAHCAIRTPRNNPASVIAHRHAAGPILRSSQLPREIIGGLAIPN